VSKPTKIELRGLGITATICRAASYRERRRSSGITITSHHTGSVCPHARSGRSGAPPMIDKVDVGGTWLFGHKVNLSRSDVICRRRRDRLTGPVTVAWQHRYHRMYITVDSAADSTCTATSCDHQSSKLLYQARQSTPTHRCRASRLSLSNVCFAFGNRYWRWRLKRNGKGKSLRIRWAKCQNYHSPIAR